MAMTADGKVDTVERQGARISGRADSARVDRLRAEADAVMVGARTLRSEDPSLRVRDPALVAAREQAGRPSQPAKVGVASRLTRAGDPVLRQGGDFLGQGEAQVIVCTTTRTDAQTSDWLSERGVALVVAGDDVVDLPAALAALRARGIERLMVEGGGTLVAALVADGLVDELQLAVAPLLFGGETAPTPVAGPGWTSAAAPRLELADVATSADGDVVLRYLLRGGDRR